MATQPSQSEANRLYWDTEASVGHIADTLGVSRRALYELLEPLAADEPCAACGGPLVFANRLARAAGEAFCGACGARLRLAPAPGHRNPDRQADADAARPSGPVARGRPTRAVAETGAPPTGDASATDSGGEAAAAARPAAEKRSAANGGRRRVASASDGALGRAAHAFGLADEREATLALARALRVFGFALIGVATGMAVMSLFFKRRH